MKRIFFILSWVLLEVTVMAQEQYLVDETDRRLSRGTYISSSADVADIDGDGDLDIVGTAWAAISPYRPYYLFVNDGRGYFTREDEPRLPDTSFLSLDVGFGDIDGDQDYDIYVVSEHEQDLLLVNDGTGYFADETFFRFPYVSCGNSGFILGDLSADASIDVITICAYDYGLNHYLLNDGLGFFQDVTSERMPLDTLFDVQGAAVDIDNDLDLDLLLSWVSEPSVHHIRCLENVDGYYVELDEERLDDRRTRFIDAVDIDSDGDLDLVVSSATDLGILINYDGTLIDETDVRLENLGPECGGPTKMGLGDYDNDGDIDIFAGYAVMVPDHLFLNDGRGYFLLADERVPDTEASTRWAVPLDADGDGDLDLFLACSGDGIQRILINYSSPDTIRPNFLAFEGPEGIVDTAARYEVKVSAYDNISVEKGALGAELSYRVNGGAFDDIEFSYCGGTIFSTAIPGQLEGTQVEYYISLTDRMGNTTTLPENAPDSLYDFWVSYRTEADGAGGHGANSDDFAISVYPNPFNSSVSISHSGLPEGSEIAIYDIRGQLIRKFELGNSSSRLVWNGKDERGEGVQSGVYFVRLRTPTGSESHKILLLK